MRRRGFLGPHPPAHPPLLLIAARLSEAKHIGRSLSASEASRDTDRRSAATYGLSILRGVRLLIICTCIRCTRPGC